MEMAAVFLHSSHDFPTHNVCEYGGEESSQFFSTLTIHRHARHNSGNSTHNEHFEFCCFFYIYFDGSSFFSMDGWNTNSRWMMIKGNTHSLTLSLMFKTHDDLSCLSWIIDESTRGDEKCEIFLHTFIQEPFEMRENIWQSGQLFTILEELSKIVGNRLGWLHLLRIV